MKEVEKDTPWIFFLKYEEHPMEKESTREDFLQKDSWKISQYLDIGLYMVYRMELESF